MILSDVDVAYALTLLYQKYLGWKELFQYATKKF